jgi:hypothetical protein
MTEARTIVWLASYPKSGNTWLRAFLANYLFEFDGPASFEAVQRISTGDASGPAYAELSGRDPRRLTLPEYVETRRRHLARIANGGAPVNFVKTHAPNGRVGGAALIPAGLTRQAIHLVRHPLDLLVSYADHWGIGLAAAARQIADAKNAVPATARSAVQFLGSWSGHVASWTGARDFPVMTLRYEDMMADSERAFTAVLRHIGAPVDGAVLARAIDAASFRRLAAMETAGGFPERGPMQKRFFREGRIGQWHDAVPEAVAQRVIRDHRAAMQRLGYL